MIASDRVGLEGGLVFQRARVLKGASEVEFMDFSTIPSAILAMESARAVKTRTVSTRREMSFPKAPWQAQEVRRTGTMRR